jgi:hypothetical protein
MSEKNLSTGIDTNTHDEWTTAVSMATLLRHNPNAHRPFAEMINLVPEQKRGAAVGYFAAEFPFPCAPLYNHYFAPGLMRQEFEGFALLERFQKEAPYDPFVYVREIDGHQQKTIEAARLSFAGAPTVNDLDARAVLPQGTFEIVRPYDIWMNEQQKHTFHVTDCEFLVAKDACEKFITEAVAAFRKSTRTIFGFSMKRKEQRRVAVRTVMQKGQTLFKSLHDTRAAAVASVHAEALQRGTAFPLGEIKNEIHKFRTEINVLWTELSKINE